MVQHTQRARYDNTKSHSSIRNHQWNTRRKRSMLPINKHVHIYPTWITVNYENAIEVTCDQHASTETLLQLEPLESLSVCDLARLEVKHVHGKVLARDTCDCNFYVRPDMGCLELYVLCRETGERHILQTATPMTRQPLNMVFGAIDGSSINRMLRDFLN